MVPELSTVTDLLRELSGSAVAQGLVQRAVPGRVSRDQAWVQRGHWRWSTGPLLEIR